MIKCFQRKKNKPVVLSPYVECRSWYGTAFHIRDTRDESGNTLCEYKPLDDRSPLTFDEFLKRSQNQHEGWHYCSTCAQIFHLLHDNDSATRLIHQYYDCLAGLWCDACHEWGSHESNEHQAFVIASVLQSRQHISDN